MALHAAALYCSDADGRLIGTRHAAAGPGLPRLFIGVTRHGILWRLAAGLPDALARELSRLAGAELPPPELGRAPERLAALRERLDRAAPVEACFHGEVWRFPERIERVAGAVGEVGRDLDPALLAQSWPDRAPCWSRCRPIFGVTLGSRLVSVAWSATPPPSAAADPPGVEVAVETLPGFRGRGLAGRALAALAGAGRQRGWDPLYACAREDRPGRALATRLGLIHFGTDLWLR